MPNVFVSHQPLLNAQGKIVAIRLTLYPDNEATTSDVAMTLKELHACWPASDQQIFLDFTHCLIDNNLLAWEIPENTTIEVPSQALTGQGSEEFVAALKVLKPSLCLLCDDTADQAALETGLHFRYIACNAQNLTPPQLKLFVLKTQAIGSSIAFRVGDEQAFRDCLDADIRAAACWFFKSPSAANLTKTLNPGQAQIMRVINLLRKNAEVHEIEEALKQDVTISYKLLRYISSAGFGLSCEIQSFRHAVTILGYNKLNKWLSLLLVTASKDPMAPALMHTALTRACFMEKVAHDIIGKKDDDNLFITGAFSLLDALLGVKMDKVLESMSLPEPINDTLLEKEGIYTPFLNLAKASEDGGNTIVDHATLLGISASRFNRAKMEALNFAEDMAK